MINDTLQNRRYVISIIMSAVIVVYILRLFTIQIIDTKYKNGADSNAFLKKTQFPPRGLIYDRKHTLLVYNKPAYDIALIFREIHDLDTIAFCKALNIDKQYFLNRIAEIKDYRKNPGYSTYTPQIFMTQLGIENIATIQQSMYKYPGFYIQSRTLREYAFHTAAHVLGSIGEVSQTKIDNDDYYKQGDFAGRDGIEKTYEEQLRGEKGVEILLRDAKGRIKGKYENGKEDIAPKAGQNLTLTLDVQLQMLAEKLLTGKVGSVVAIEPSTGEILAMACSPSFDPSILVGRQRSKNYMQLVNDPTKPLINRATQALYSPGSSFKTLQALVLQQMGGINEHTLFACNGPETYPIKCTHHHGSPVNLLSAVQESCNPYFWNAFKVTVEKNGYGPRNINFRTTYDEWVNRVKSFGLGEKFTDSDIYEQSRGYIPTQKFYNKVYRSEKGWRAITIRSNSIGQGEILATPLQMANLMCAISNEGRYISPHLNKCDSMLKKVHYCKVDKKYFPIVFEAMWRVFEYGTARSSKIEGIDMCGKTGTADNSHGKPHSVFVGFAPRVHPKIAIAVVVENAGYGSTYAAPIFSLLMDQYLKGKITRTDLEERTINTVTNSNVQER
ncbi:MAG: penicillin-binding transpeptidase domain-containing protein [Bacteroidota bacterium]|nr:penicillin-binding transpeptidase domain-containing protein [Bacteroidota bacterium]